MTGAMAGPEQTRLLAFDKLTVWWGHLSRTACASTASTKYRGGRDEISRVGRQGGGETFAEGVRVEQRLKEWIRTIITVLFAGCLPCSWLLILTEEKFWARSACLQSERLTTRPEHFLWPKQNKSLGADWEGKDMPGVLVFCCITSHHKLCDFKQHPHVSYLTVV